MVPLIIGFSIQLGLFLYLKMALKNGYNTSGVATNTGISAGAMLACCLHHLVEILPFLGLAALSVFISEYQKNLFLFGFLTSIVGITYMLNIMQQTGLLSTKFEINLDMRFIKKVIIFLAIIIFILSFF